MGYSTKRKTRTFNGKRYKRCMSYDSKSAAQKAAKNARKRGRLARVIPIDVAHHGRGHAASAELRKFRKSKIASWRYQLFTRKK